MQAAKDKYGDSFAMISIAKNDPEKPRQFVQEKGYSWIFGHGDHVLDAYNVGTIPHTVFISRDGWISHTQVEYMTDEQFNFHLERILQ